MDKISHDTLLKQLHWRYAVKKFDSSRKIPAEDWELLEEALRLAPSSYGLQPWRFLVVQSPQMRHKLTAASYGQPQIETCSHLVVFTHMKTVDEAHVASFLKSVADHRNLQASQLQGYHDVIVNDVVKGPRAATIAQWTARQAYIAMGSLMTIAALLQVDASPMEGIETAKYDDLLDLNKTPFTTVAAVGLGYRAQDDQMQHAKKVRFPKKDIIQHV